MRVCVSPSLSLCLCVCLLRLPRQKGRAASVSELCVHQFGGVCLKLEPHAMSTLWIVEVNVGKLNNTLPSHHKEQILDSLIDQKGIKVGDSGVCIEFTMMVLVLWMSPVREEGDQEGGRVSSVFS